MSWYRRIWLCMFPGGCTHPGCNRRPVSTTIFGRWLCRKHKGTPTPLYPGGILYVGATPGAVLRRNGHISPVWLDETDSYPDTEPVLGEFFSGPWLCPEPGCENETPTMFSRCGTHGGIPIIPARPEAK